MNKISITNLSFSFLFLFSSPTWLNAQAIATESAFTAQELAAVTRSGDLSINYVNEQASGLPIEKLKNSFRKHSSDLSGFMDLAFKEGSAIRMRQYAESGRTISIPEDEKLSPLDFFMADFLTRGSKDLTKRTRRLEYVIHRSESYDRKIENILSKENFEAIYGSSVTSREINPVILKTVEELDEYAKQNHFEFHIDGDPKRLFPMIRFDFWSPVYMKNEQMIILDVGGRLKVYDSIEEISDEDARQATKAYVSLENFHKLDNKLTGQEYENLNTDWLSKLFDLYQASKQKPIGNLAADILKILEDPTCQG